MSSDRSRIGVDDTREDLAGKIGLCFVKGITAGVVRRVRELEMPLREFYELDTNELNTKLGLGHNQRFEKLNREEALFKGREELKFVERHHLRVYSLLDDDYPMLLGEIPDAPVVLFKYGEAELDSEAIIGIVGTRRCTPYGLNFCSSVVKELGVCLPGLTVVSGLAYGIDASAHQASLDNNVTTIAVVAHGLDTIYPASHRDLAKEIIRSGGAIVSEYPSGTKALRSHFLARNRIVAGLSEALLVVESEIKGGAMSTANAAFMYNREVMALPGRISDQMSAGCNHLIRKEKAHLITCGTDVIELTGWKPLGLRISSTQRNLFPELTGVPAQICNFLRNEAEPVSVDRIHQLSGINVGELISTLSELEFDGVIIKYPGNRYSMA